MEIAVFALYGVPRGVPALDLNYRWYFQLGLGSLDPTQVIPIHFAGGATDPSRPTLTEAGAALEVFQALHLSPERYPLHPHPAGLDCREAFEAIAESLAADVAQVTVFCAWTHKFHTEYLAHKILGAGGRRKVTVVGLVFPLDIGFTGMVWGRVSRIPRFFLSVGSWHSEAIRVYEWRLRLRHMRRCAAYPERLPPKP